MAASNDAPYVITRRDALAAGQLWYFEKPCLHGHLAKRLTKSKNCLECHRQHRARVRADRPEDVKAQKAASYLKHRAATIAHVKEYTETNREKVRVRRHKYREANKEQIAERYKAWAKENRPILRVHERRRRDRKRGATGSHTLADIQDIGAMQRWRCASPECRRPIRSGWHEDHIQPLAKDGTDDRRNIQLLCPKCNQAKHARDPIEWAQSLGRLL